jgi:hypothetical protein
VSKDGTTYEVSVEAKEVIYNRRLVGIVDVIDGMKNIVYELKCVQTVTSENILQLAIYAWMIEGLNLNRQAKVTYKLFNIFTNEVIEVIYNEKIKGMVEFLVKAKYGSLERCSDEEFIEKCLKEDIKEVVFGKEEKCLL